MFLFFDTETTGIPDKNLPDDHASQPHIAQLAAILTDEAGEELSSVNFLIEPQGYKIPEVVAKIHGITTEIATAFGVPSKLAMSSFKHLALKATTLVAHNIGFDIRMVEIECLRLGVKIEFIKDQFCTMEATRNLVKLPATERMIAAGFTQFKSPKLIEAYQHIFAKGFDNAHDALADVRACKEIFFWLRANKAGQP